MVNKFDYLVISNYVGSAKWCEFYVGGVFLWEKAFRCRKFFVPLYLDL